jgi:hypothetical protein
MSLNLSGIREQVGGGEDLPQKGAFADGDGMWCAYLGRMRLMARTNGGGRLLEASVSTTGSVVAT